MSLLWTSVSFLLGVELLVLLLLVLPLPWGVRKNVSRWIHRVKAQERLASLFKYILFALFLALMETINSLRTVHIRRELENGDGKLSDPSLQLAGIQNSARKKIRAERNLYLIGFAITAIMAIVRLVKLAAIEVQLRDKIKEYNGNRPLTETGETIEGKND